MEPRHDKGDLACMTVSTEDFSRMDAHSVPNASCLIKLPTDRLDNETRRKMSPNSKRSAVWNESLFCRASDSLRLFPHEHVRGPTTKSYHDNFSH